MRVILTLLCRNEEDIVDHMIRFHLKQGVDHIIATDNGSTDRTLNILRHYEQQGVLHLLQEPEHNHDQAIWVTRMARMAASEYAADWVINSDADEFWQPTAGNIKSTLQSIPEEVQALAINRFNFLPNQIADNSELPFYNIQTIRERISLNNLGRPLPPKICHRAHSAISIKDGNHAALLFGDHVSIEASGRLQILHFPIRSYAQFELKIKQGAEALNRNQRISNEVGKTWRLLYEKYLIKGELYKYYRELCLDKNQIISRLNAGLLIKDCRIQEALGIPSTTPMA